MKKLFYVCFLLCIPLIAHAEFVPEADAEAIASQFLNTNVAAKSGRQNAFSRVRMQKVANVLPQQHFYIFNSEDGNGFVIVSANDIARPILGYSEKGTIDVNNLPSNLQWWLGEYNSQIEAGLANNIPATADIQKEWEAFKYGKAQSASVVVGPLLTTQWDQGTPYNDMCPIYTGTKRAFSGCVATATAQIMNYHQYPISGIGSKTYTTNTHQFTLSADFANTTYDWRNIKDSYDDLSSCSQAQKEAIATLMYHVGVASEMEYAMDADGQSGSHNSKAAYGLLHYFGYASDMMYIEREMYNSDVSYIATLQRQLDKAYPILYRGNNEKASAGHSFVCDGYNSDYYFHFNWGWSGFCDGYYSIAALQPGSGGSGSGEGNYNYNQGIVVNIHPDDGNQSYNLQLCSDILTINDSITQGDMISRDAMIMNVGKEAITINIYFVAVNQHDATQVYWLDSLVNQTLTTCNVIDYIVESNPTHIAGAVAHTFQTENTFDMEEGDYYLAFIFKDTKADTLGLIGSDYTPNVAPLHIKTSPYLHSGKYFVIAESTDAYWFMSSDLTSTSTKRLVADTLAQKDELYWIHNDPKFVWNVTRTDALNYTIENNGKYLSWTSGNSATMSTAPKEFGIYPLGDEDDLYAVQLDVPNADPRFLSYNTANDLHYFAFYQNTNQQYALRFVEVVEFDSVTIRAKMPSAWGETISCWVWYDGYMGEWKTPTKNGDWYEYSGIAGFNITFVNGTTWSNDNNQTNDILSVNEDICIQVNSNTSGKRNYTQIDCPESEPTQCALLPYIEPFSDSQGAFTEQVITGANGLTKMWTFTSAYGMKISGRVSGTNYKSESWLISPCINLTTVQKPILSFSHTHKFAGTPTDELTLWISTNYTGGTPSSSTWKQLTIPTYATNTDWTFVSSGDIDLSAFIGNNVNIAWKYTSTASYAATWEVKNVVVKDAPQTSNLSTATQNVVALGNKSKIDIFGTQAGDNIDVYSAAGICILHTTATSDVECLSVPAGFYLVKIGQRTHKVVVR